MLLAFFLTLLLSRFLPGACARAPKYGDSGFLPGYANRSDMTSVTFVADMGNLSFVNMGYRFYSLLNITSFTGFGNLRKAREPRYTFSGCTALIVLDFRGLDTSGLQSLQYTFTGCSNLVTIYAVATWALPASGCSGSSTFYNCKKLVGGNGTTYASGRMAYQYMRIDYSMIISEVSNPITILSELHNYI